MNLQKTACILESRNFLWSNNLTVKEGGWSDVLEKEAREVKRFISFALNSMLRCCGFILFSVGSMNGF
jgi:hypothetical protein